MMIVPASVTLEARWPEPNHNCPACGIPCRCFQPADIPTFACSHKETDRQACDAVANIVKAVSDLAETMKSGVTA